MEKVFEHAVGMLSWKFRGMLSPIASPRVLVWEQWAKPPVLFLKIPICSFPKNSIISCRSDIPQVEDAV